MNANLANITSLNTYFYKYILPISFVPWDGFRRAWANIPRDQKFMFWLFIVFWCIMTPWVFWYAWRLKKVLMDEKYLYVKNYLKEIRVPISEVSGLNETSWPRMKHVTLKLKTPSAFGAKIVFIPKKYIKTADGERFVVEELKDRIGV